MNKLIALLNTVVGLAAFLYYALEPVLDMDFWGILSWCMLVVGAFSTYMFFQSSDAKGGAKAATLITMALVAYHTLGGGDFGMATWAWACVSYGAGFGILHGLRNLMGS